jgi:hypothetical protein
MAGVEVGSRLVKLTVTALSILMGAFVAIVLPSGASAAGTCEELAEAAENALVLGMSCPDEPTTGMPAEGISESHGEPAYVEYVWSSVCVPFNPNRSMPQPPDCVAARVCPDAMERLWDLWGRPPAPNGGWVPLGSECFGRPPTVADTPRPQVTPGMVLNALRRIGLPELTARTQPADKTLVNFATIFYAEPEPFARSIRLLGRQVDVEATPSQFTWHYGDGTSESTTTPGAPYPSKEITYSYTDAHTTVSTSVDVTYAARFRVNGGGWQDIAETVTITGPPTDLRISEATAVLSGNYE